MSDSVENCAFNDKNKWDISLLPCCSCPCMLKHRARITNTTTMLTLSIAKTPSKLNKHYLSLLSFVSNTDHDRCCNLFRPIDLCTRKHYVIVHVRYWIKIKILTWLREFSTKVVFLFTISSYRYSQWRLELKGNQIYKYDPKASYLC